MSFLLRPDRVCDCQQAGTPRTAVNPFFLQSAR